MSSEEPWVDDPRYGEFDTDVKFHATGFGEVALVRFGDGGVRIWSRLVFEDGAEAPWREVS